MTDEPWASTIYTLEEAQALLPELRERLVALRDAFADLAGHQEFVRSLSPRNGSEEQPGAGSDLSQKVAEQLAWFNDDGIMVRDVEQGLVDFPAKRDGEDILLCWKLGEESVAFWHYPDTGFEGRQPL